MSIELVQNAVLVAFAVVVMATDWRWRRIPNIVTYPVMAFGLGLAALESFPGQLAGPGFVDHLVATIGVLLALYPIYNLGAVKAGDVKLLMGVGALKGLVFLFWSLVYGALIGGVVALAYIAVQRLLRGRSLGEVLRTFIPYGVSLAAGALVALAAGVE